MPYMCYGRMSVMRICLFHDYVKQRAVLHKVVRATEKDREKQKNSETEKDRESDEGKREREREIEKAVYRD